MGFEPTIFHKYHNQKVSSIDPNVQHANAGKVDTFLQNSGCTSCSCAVSVAADRASADGCSKRIWCCSICCIGHTYR